MMMMKKVAEMRDESHHAGLEWMTENVEKVSIEEVSKRFSYLEVSTISA